eukprot:GEMP01035729.1.p1 GENE.GEMP01035729.1~~GEMP01035729.1.p1  ORF type:complete len:393 (+),score=78.59 GEMP01035729.1:112-1290(+)
MKGATCLHIDHIFSHADAVNLTPSTRSTSARGEPESDDAVTNTSSAPISSTRAASRDPRHEQARWPARRKTPRGASLLSSSSSSNCGGTEEDIGAHDVDADTTLSSSPCRGWTAGRGGTESATSGHDHAPASRRIPHEYSGKKGMTLSPSHHGKVAHGAKDPKSGLFYRRATNEGTPDKLIKVSPSHHRKEAQGESVGAQNGKSGLLVPPSSSYHRRPGLHKEISVASEGQKPSRIPNPQGRALERMERAPREALPLENTCKRPSNESLSSKNPLKTRETPSQERALPKKHSQDRPLQEITPQEGTPQMQRISTEKRTSDSSTVCMPRREQPRRDAESATCSMSVLEIQQGLVQELETRVSDAWDGMYSLERAYYRRHVQTIQQLLRQAFSE